MRTSINRWCVIVSVALASVILSGCGASQPRSAPAATVSPGVTGTVVTIASKDFAFTFDTPTIRPGTVTFVLKNDGPTVHDFAIRGQGLDRRTAMIPAGQTASLTVELKPGVYTYVCTIPGHDHLGMKGSFTVA